MEPLNTYIDHTLLKSDARRMDVLRLVEEARFYEVASVCVNPCYASLVREHLLGSAVKTCVVVGFPLGATSTAAKAVEASFAVRDGAQEIDMVVNIGFVKDGAWDDVRADIAAVVAASKPALVKVILETCLLNEDEKIRACEAARDAGAAFVKTSTGFSTGGATVADVMLMRRVAGADMGVKASGGIHTREQAEAMIAAGATRIGCSATAKILG